MTRLKNLRKEKKLSQQQVADFLCVSNQTYSNYETGAREPDNENLKKLADFFNVSTDFLLDYESTYAYSIYNNDPKAVKLEQTLKKLGVDKMSEEELKRFMDFAEPLAKLIKKD